ALMILSAGAAWSQPQTRIRLLPDEERYFTVGLMGGFYFLQDEVFQDLYGKGAPFFGAEMTLRIPIRDPHGLDIAAGARTLSKKGQTSHTEEDLSLRLTDLSLSLRYSYDTGRFAIFLGPGIEYITYKETYAETFPIDSVTGSKIGMHLTGGGYVHLTSGLSLKGYVKYCLVQTDKPGFRVNLGGTEWGAGILYRFYF
ncbi:MAG: outer membrane beta-barrel protein, partial [Candidatus Aminicenantes bacterium]|nr:outer membrane beta-barrel protein [Candidatus Aminicenantes bacterium]